MENVLRTQSNAVLKQALLEIVHWQNTGTMKDKVFRILHNEINEHSIIKFGSMDVQHGITLELAKRYAGLSTPPETTRSDPKAFSLEAGIAMAIKESKLSYNAALLIENPGEFYSVAVGKYCVEYQKRRHPERIVDIYVDGEISVLN